MHLILDSIDAQLISGADSRLSELVELANLSAIIGNLFRTGVCRSSDGMFLPNTPHTYPDSYLTMAKHRFRLSSALTEWQYPRCRLIFARHSLRPSCSRTE